MQGDVRRLRGAPSTPPTSPPPAAAWLAADARYESIGAAYGAFGDLDAAINGEPAGCPAA